jgi:peptidoglycan/xylan/chitin deacetylase (PgdA/CDA1 family)
MYHEIYQEEERQRLSGLTNPAYNIEVSSFRRQMAFLQAEGVNSLTIEELHAGRFHGQRSICLTFDDGWLGNYRHAYPILREYGFRGTFFVTTDFIGKPLYMTWDYLAEMKSHGMSIQSHAVTHRPLAGLVRRDLTFELLISKKVIEKNLSAQVRHLSLPHGLRGAKIWPLARQIGYQSICTSDAGFYDCRVNSPWIKRIRIGDGETEKKFRLIALGESRAIRRMVLSQRLKASLKKAIGWNLYRKLYQLKYKFTSLC